MLLVAESKTSPFQKPQIAAEDQLPTRPTDAALETGPHAKVPAQCESARPISLSIFTFHKQAIDQVNRAN